MKLSNFPPPLKHQVRAPEAISLLHEETKWNRYEMPGISMRILHTLSNPGNYERYAKHGKTYVDGNRAVLSADHSFLSEGIRNAFTKRQSLRNLKHCPLESSHLASLLIIGAGNFREHLGRYSIANGASPSAGGLYPINVYVISANQSANGEAEFSVSYFDRSDCSLTEFRQIGPVEMSCIIAAGRVSSLPSFGTVVVLTATFSRSTEKYGARGYRFSILEAGHIAQNFLLCAADIGIGAYCYGGYLDNETSDALGIDGIDEAPVHCIIFGYENDASAGKGVELNEP